MRDILLILMLTSCIGLSSTSTTFRKTSYFLGGEEIDEKELQINEKSYKLVDTIELGKRDIYKIYKQDQEDITNKIIYNIYNAIIISEEQATAIKEVVCKQLEKDGEYTSFSDNSKGPIKIFIEEKMDFIYENLKNVIFKHNSTADEINLLFNDIISEISLGSPKVRSAIISLFTHGYTSFGTYRLIENYLPANVNDEFKDAIFKAIKQRDYKKVRNILESSKDYFEKIVNNTLVKLEKEKFIALRDKIASTPTKLTIPLNGSSGRSIESKSTNLTDTYLVFGGSHTLYYKGIPLVLRKYTKK